MKKAAEDTMSSNEPRTIITIAYSGNGAEKKKEKLIIYISNQVCLACIVHKRSRINAA